MRLVCPGRVAAAGADAAIGLCFAAMARRRQIQRRVGWWQALGATFVRVDGRLAGPPPSGDICPVPASEENRLVLEDVDGAFRDWLLASPGDEVIVLRPDRYVAAVTDRQGLEEVTRAHEQLIGETRRAGNDG